MKKSILYLIPRFTTGGAERLVLEYVRQLQKENVPVAVASVVDSGEMKSEFEDLGVQVVIGEPGVFGRLRTWLRLVKFVRIFRPTIIHTHIYSADVCGWLIKTFVSPEVQWISTQHNVRESSTAFRRLVLKIFLGKADKIIAVADSVATFCRTLGVGDDKIIVVRNSIPLDAWLTVPIDKLLSEEKLHLATIGRLEYQKGHDILLRALALLPLDMWQLEIFGSGRERKQLTSLAKELGIEKNIVWYGVVHNFIGQLASVDIVIQPSRYEGMSLAIMESMAAGRVIIASTAAGDGVVEDKITGFVVPVGDTKSIANAVIFASKNRDAARKLALNARAVAREKFLFSKHWGEIRRVYGQE